jgi:hypothetical protein
MNVWKKVRRAAGVKRAHSVRIAQLCGFLCALRRFFADSLRARTPRRRRAGPGGSLAGRAAKRYHHGSLINGFFDAA